MRINGHLKPSLRAEKLTQSRLKLKQRPLKIEAVDGVGGKHLMSDYVGIDFKLTDGRLAPGQSSLTSIISGT